MKKVLITATVQSHIAQFHIPLIKLLKEWGYEVHCAAKNNLDVKPGLSLDIADKIYDVPFSRSPFGKSNIKAYKEMKKILKNTHYDIVHCNTPMGGVVTRLAAGKHRKKGTKVIYTAHGFHFFKGAPTKNWLMYYPMEWFLSFKTDDLICINNEDYELAKKKMHAKRIDFIHGVGFDKKRFDEGLTKEKARNILGISPNTKVLLSVGDLNKRKNHQVIIKALQYVKCDDFHLYIAGWDQLDGKLTELAKECKVADKVTFVGYTRQLSEYFAAADLFLFSSLQEGLPIALMEAMSWGLPAVASNIRGNNDLIEDGTGGKLLEPMDISGFAQGINFLLDNEDKMRSMGNRNKKFIKKYEVENVVKEIKKIYKSL